MYLINILISAVIIISGIIIGTQNNSVIVDVHLFGWTFNNLSLSLVMLECMLIGMIIILLIAIFYELKQRAKFWKMQKRVKELEKELEKLRTLIADEMDIEKNEDDKEQKSKEQENNNSE